jgi:hypothetical protein
MTANVGMIDRVLRILLGLLLVSLVFWGPQTPWGWVGLILIGTGAIKFCPVYSLFGLHTCRY